MPHIHEKIDFTVEVFIVHQRRVFLRKHDKYKVWLSVGGHIELDEDPNQAAVREAKEETGLDIVLQDTRLLRPKREGFEELIPPRGLNRHNINETHEHVTMSYYATSETDEIKPSGNDQSDEWKWFTMEELEKTTTASGRIFYSTPSAHSRNSANNDVGGRWWTMFKPYYELAKQNTFFFLPPCRNIF